MWGLTPRQVAPCRGGVLEKGEKIATTSRKGAMVAIVGKISLKYHPYLADVGMRTAGDSAGILAQRDMPSFTAAGQRQIHTALSPLPLMAAPH